MPTNNNVEDIYPLAPMQSGMLFEYLADHTSPVYHEQNTYRFNGALNVDIVEQAVAFLCRRHTVLRTAFVYENMDAPLQVVLANREIKFSHYKTPSTTQLETIRANDRASRFDLTRDPLMRVTLVEIKNDEFELIWTFHHIIMDGWCINILTAEFYQIYTQIAKGQAVQLPPAVPYAKFIQYITAVDKDAHLLYWKNYLKGYDGSNAALPKQSSGKQTPAIRTKYTLQLSTEETVHFRSACRKYNVTEGAYLRAVWAVVLSKFTHKEDVIFGSIVHGRPAAIGGADTMIGLFINNIPVRVKCAGDTSFVDLLKNVQKDILAVERHQYVSLAEIKAGRKELFDSIFLFQNFLDQGIAEQPQDGSGLNGLTLSDVGSTDNIPHDLLIITSAATNVLLEITYNTLVYEDQFITGLAANLKYFLLLSLQYADILLKDFFPVAYSPELSFQEIISQHTHRNYWLSRFGTLTSTEPAQKARLTGVFHTINYTPGSALTLFLRETAASYSLSAVLTASLKVLLYRYRGVEDITTGMFDMATHSKSGTLNKLAIKDHIRGNEVFADVLGKVSQSIADAHSSNTYTYQQLLNDLTLIIPGFGKQELFDVIISVHDNEIWTALEKDECPLVFLFREQEEVVELQIRYAEGVYTESDIKKMMTHYETLMLSVLEDPYKEIGKLKMLSVAELDLLKGYNDTARPAYDNKTLLDLYNRHLEGSASQPAIVYNGEIMTYGELDRQANRVGNYLRGKGVKEETIVGVCLERSMDVIVAILGILKAGAVYMPVDPEYPVARIKYMLEDSKCRIIMTNAEWSYLLQGDEMPELLLIDTEKPIIDGFSDAAPQIGLAPHNAAYVIYTSGSTGQPKGVINEHRGIVSHLLWMQEYFGLTTDDVVLQKTTLSFDVAVWELLWPLMEGAILVFAKPGGQKDAAYLRELITREKISYIHFVPSMLQAFLDFIQPGDCASLKKVLCSGEALKANHVALFRGKLPQTELHNLYGPTEAAIDVTCWSMPETNIHQQTPPIGRPVANTAIYILDANKQLVPPGAKGELYIGGMQVARGYANRATLTAERFIEDPFSMQQGTYMYKSGDAARWLDDGQLEFLGRIDEQVKVRGYRIEPGEIEQTLIGSGMVKQAVVLALPDHNGDQRLIAYVVPLRAFSKDTARAYLKDKLPAYMQPAQLIQLEHIPLTTNGKIDKKALAAIPADNTVQNSAITPRTDTEIRLAAIWRKVLGADSIGIHDNFFGLGGHSLLVLSLISAIHEEFSIELSIQDVLYNHTTLESLAAHLQAVKPQIPEVHDL